MVGGSWVRTLLLSWLSRLDDLGAPKRPQRPQRPGRSNKSVGPQAVRTPALVNECWEPGDPGSNWLGHLDQRAETLTHGCHPRETCRDVDVDNVCPHVRAFASVSLTNMRTHTHIHSVTAERRSEECGGKSLVRKCLCFIQEKDRGLLFIRTDSDRI